MGSTGNAPQTFQPAVYLGASINLLNPDCQIFSIQLLFGNPELLITDPSYRAINPSDKTQNWPLSPPLAPINNVPVNININPDQKAGESQTYFFNSGRDVRSALAADASFKAGYMGVKAEGSVSYSSTSEFSTNKMYAFSNFSRSAWVASFSDWSEINTSMVNAAKQLPSFDYQSGKLPSEDVVAKYTNFFQNYGTHTVTSMDYGWRLQEQIEQSNSSSTDVENFKANVNISYMGNQVGGGVETKEELQQFQNSATVSVYTIGGDPSFASVVDTNYTNYQAKLDYEGSFGKNNDAGTTGIGVETLGWLLSKGGLEDLGTQLDGALYLLAGGYTRHLGLQPPLATWMLEQSPFVWTLQTPNCNFLLSDGTTSTTWTQTLSQDPKNPDSTYQFFDPLPPIQLPMVDTISLQLYYNLNLVTKAGLADTLNLVVSPTPFEPELTYNTQLPTMPETGTNYTKTVPFQIPVNVAKDAIWKIR